MIPLIFRNKNFLFVWIGQVLSQSGTRMYQIAIIWWLLTTMKGGGSEIAYFMIALSLPSLLFVRKIGNIIERTSSKKVFLLAELCGCLTVVGVVLFIYFDKFTIPMALLAGFLLALFQAFIDPTLLKAVPELCDEDDSTTGVAFITSTQALSNFGGAVLGAVLIDLLGLFGVTIFNGISYVLCVFFLLFVKFRKSRHDDENHESFVDLHPLELLGKMPFIKKILIGFGFANFFLNPILIILPIYTNKVLNESASILGILEGALWTGILVGSFSAKFVTFFRGKPIKLASYMLAVQGLLLISAGFVIQTFFFMSILFIIGTFLGVFNVKIIDFYQKNVKDEYKGRFFAVLQAVVTFTFPITYFLFGHLAEYIEVNYLCIVQGVGLVIVGVYFTFIKVPKLGVYN